MIEAKQPSRVPTPSANKLSGGIISARLLGKKPKPVKAVDVEVDVVVSNDVLAVVETDEGTVLNLFILDYIDGYGSTDPEVLISHITAYQPARINCYIGSGGGDVMIAATISDILRGGTAYVTAYLTGICASAATHVACAADRVVMSSTCFYMVHSASVYVGNIDANEIDGIARMISVVNDTQLTIYSQKTGKTKAELEDLLVGENYMTAEQALELGFVDEVVESITMDLSLPGDVRLHYSNCYREDYYWYAFVDHETGEVRNEADVFTACLGLKEAKLATAKAKPAVAPDPTPTPPISNLSIVEDSAQTKSTIPMDLYNKIVAELTKLGLLSKDKTAEAVTALTAQNATFTASIAKAVKAQLDEEATVAADLALEAGETTPTTGSAQNAKTLQEQIDEMSEEDLETLRLALAGAPADTTEADEAAAAKLLEMEEAVVEAKAAAKRANDSLKELTAQISARRAGRPGAKTAATAPETNGKADTTPEGKPNAGDEVHPAVAAIEARIAAAGGFKK